VCDRVSSPHAGSQTLCSWVKLTEADGRASVTAVGFRWPDYSSNPLLVKWVEEMKSALTPSHVYLFLDIFFLEYVKKLCIIVLRRKV